MPRATSLCIALSLLFALSLPASPAQAGMREEAERQLRFARDELTEERFERALASAESALRLEPTLYDAMIVKALAYEGLGDLKMAEVLLIAHGEVATGLKDRPDVDEALARVQASMAEEEVERKAGRRGRRGSPTPSGPVVVEQVDQSREADRPTALDPAPFKERVERGLSEGKCSYARAAALELTAAASHKADGYRLLGDAARCDGSTREAVGAYRRFKTLGGVDSKVDLMLRSLGESLASVAVSVVFPGETGPVPPRVSLDLPGETLVEQVGGGAVTFADLPVGQELTLGVVGRGLEPHYAAVQPLQPGEARVVELTPTWIGLGEVQLSQFDQELCTVAFVAPDGEFALEPGETRSVTAGTVTAEVTNAYGTIGVPMDVQASDQVVFDPLPWLPSELTLIQLPSGSSVRVFVEGVDGAIAERQLQVPAGTGQIDPKTGVRVADPQKVDSLPGGSAGIFVTHPVLGAGNISTALAPAEANATTFDWRTMDGLSRVSAAYGDWKTAHLQASRQAAGGTAAPAAITVGSGIASGILWGVAISTGRQVSELKSQAEAAEGAELDDLRNQHGAAAHKEHQLLWAAGITSGTAVIGGVLTGVFGSVGHKKVLKLGEWDPARAAE